MILSVFFLWVTFQPNLFIHEIIYLDQGLYLPAIRAIFEGQIPFRDFMLYRGPLEVYAPAAMMKIIGDNMIWLPVFFYVTNLLNMWLAIMLAYRLLRTRFMFALFVPVFIARTFPRVSFYYWGGLRYALGMWAVYTAVRFLQTKKTGYLFWGGVAVVLGFLTTIELGVTGAAAVMTGLVAGKFFGVIDWPSFRKGAGRCALGFCLIAVPYGIFLWQTQSLWPYIEATFVIPLRMTSSFLIIDTHIPSGFWHFTASLWPASNYFKVLTPVYFYLFLIAFFIYRSRQIGSGGTLAALCPVAVYALILYAASFRAIWGHHFEMALQPQKILYFFMVEEVFLIVWMTLSSKLRERPVNKVTVFFLGFLIVGLIGSSLGYSLARYSRHFPAYKNLLDRVTGRYPQDYSLLRDVEKRPLNIPRAKGMVVPKWQADDIEATVRFIQANTDREDPVLTFPELGNFNYWFDRPFVGRFPIASLSWAIEEWHAEFMRDIRETAPRYVIMTNSRHRTFPWALYFRFQGNIEKYKDVRDYVRAHYVPALRLSSLTIYQREGS